MTTTIEDQGVMRTLVETAREKIVLADHTKINHESFLRVCDLQSIDKIISDKQIPPEFAAAAQRKGVEVIQLATI